MSSHSAIVILVLSITVGYLLFDTYWNKEVEMMVSSVDGRSYLVQSLPDKQAAADLLANIRQKLEMLVSHLEKTEPSDERAQRMIKNFQPENLSEGTDNAKYTSYSINKGEKIVFCLRSRDDSKKLEDLNTMMFVALHEMGHLATESIGHTDEFWSTFKWILEHAVNIGIYKDRDYKAQPKPYCGITITDSPLHG